MATQMSEYPAKLSIDYPETPLNRTSTCFRIFAAIPIYIILAVLNGGSFQMVHQSASGASDSALGAPSGSQPC